MEGAEAAARQRRTSTGQFYKQADRQTKDQESIGVLC